MEIKDDILYIDYEMFGAKGDGVTDDFDAIVAAHEYANEHGIDVKTNPKATYYIGPSKKSAIIQTNVDFSSTKFIIDDSKVTTEDRWAHIFTVKSKKQPFDIEIPKLSKHQMKIDVNLPCNCLVIVKNDNKKQFIRFGLNQNNGSSQTDAFIVDGTGYILGEVIWDFDTITSAIAYPIDEVPLTINGGIFKEIANQAESKYTYYGRNILITRSNTTVQNLTNVVTGELDHGAPYAGFITVSQAAYVTIKDTFLSPKKTYVTIGSAGKPVSMGSYALSISNSVNVSIIRLRQNNIMDNTHWGLMGSNHCKNITLDSCLMSRFDAHENVTNLTIKNTVLGHQCFNAIGHGTMIVENVTAYGRSFLNLRADYGSSWDGDIFFKNITWYPNANADAPTFIGGPNKGDHDFGYPCYMPHRVEIDNLLICDRNRKDSYKGPAIFNTDVNQAECVDYNDKNVAYPYFFTEELVIKNSRTESGKGIKLFNGDFNRIFGNKKHIKGENRVVPNFRVKVTNVELPADNFIPESALTPEDYGENYHILPEIKISNCEGANIQTNVPCKIKIKE